MESLTDLTLEEIKSGLHAQGEALICNLCGKVFQNGEIYALDGRFLDAAHAASQHVRAHGGVFDALLKLDKRYMTLTENQQLLLQKMRQGLSDAQIAKDTGVSAATIRHQRFMFREKAKQAKVYLALFDLSVGCATPVRDAPAAIHPAATMVDDRYNTTVGEEQKILSGAFSSLEPLCLKVFPAKEKRKIVVLRRISQLFDADRSYTEAEVSAVLKDVYDDFATLRRYLIEYGFMTRTPDGSSYRLTVHKGED